MRRQNPESNCKVEIATIIIREEEPKDIREHPGE